MKEPENAAWEKALAWGRPRRRRVITNALHNLPTGAWHDAEDDLAAAHAEPEQIPARIHLGEPAVKNRR